MRFGTGDPAFLGRGSASPMRFGDRAGYRERPLQRRLWAVTVPPLSLLAENARSLQPSGINLGRIILGLRAYPRLAVSHHCPVLKSYFSESKRCEDSMADRLLHLPPKLTACSHASSEQPKRTLADPGIGASTSHVSRVRNIRHDKTGRRGSSIARL